MLDRPGSAMTGIRRSVAFVILLLWTVGCGLRNQAESAPGPATLFPESVSGWTPASPVASYDRDRLTELVNGQAEAYFAYGFESVAVRTYENAGGVTLRVEIWALSEPANAYGLFTWSRAGEPVGVGNSGDVDAGRRIAFWQARYYVQLRAAQPVPATELVSFAENLSARLPQGGQTPDLLSVLPEDGRRMDEAVYFRRELAIQDLIWLGGIDLLALDGRAAGVVAPYERDGQIAMLMVVAYPEATEAEGAASRLAEAGLDRMVAVSARDSLVAAVFGDVEANVADALIDDALAMAREDA